MQPLQDVRLMLNLFEWTLQLVLQSIGAGLQTLHVSTHGVQGAAQLARMTGLGEKGSVLLAHLRL